jgi:hypothetical protein
VTISLPAAAAATLADGFTRLIVMATVGAPPQNS